MRRGCLISLAIAVAGTAIAEPPDEPRHPMLIRNPPTLGTLDTGLRDASGASVGVACATCHEPDDPGALARKNEVPSDFHAGIAIVHGDLACASCHDQEDRTRLRLANGETLAMDDVVLLCGQCHGPKYRDFVKGSHGGGRGYWDLSQGPWIRNSCVACHAAPRPCLPHRHARSAAQRSVPERSRRGRPRG